nr:hypothetical protein [Tanacetum cinerariifolium]
MDFDNGNGGPVDALQHPPLVPEDVVPIKAELVPAKKKVMRVPMARRGLGIKDGRPIDGKGIGRKVLDKVHETYGSELAGKEFAYDGEKSLFTLGALPRSKLDFTVVLENATSNRNNGSASPENDADKKRLRRAYQSKTFKVELSFSAQIPMQAIAQALRARQGCLLERHSFFCNDPKNFADVGRGVLGCRGFHSSFRTSQCNLDFDNGNGGHVDALPPPSLVPEDVITIKAELVPAKKKVMLVPMARCGLGTKAHPQSSDHMAADRNLYLLDVVYIPDLSTLIHDIISPSLDL